MDGVLHHSGTERAQALVSMLKTRLVESTGGSGGVSLTTPFRNTIPVDREPEYPGDNAIERRIRSLTRWNALAMVLRANDNKEWGELGGHLGTFSSLATILDVFANHFCRGDADGRKGDVAFYQAHASPGVYARAFLEGRLTRDHLEHFRREVTGRGLSSYPHPRLMPEFWQMPSASMGLGPITGVYFAQTLRYLQNRGIVNDPDRRVWCFCGDGEMDEPEAMGALTKATREKLDNLFFVVNCNLQRLDGPVRGNGKIIQELEEAYRGAGWNVIKVVWGRHWDPLFAKDTDGQMQDLMDQVVDGDLQNYKAKGGAYTREHFFGRSPDVLERVSHLTDEQVYSLNRGGHDPWKIHAAFQQAVSLQNGRPTCILFHTVKGYGMGSPEASNRIHQLKHLTTDDIRSIRDRFEIPVADADLDSLPFVSLEPGSVEHQYLMDHRAALGGPAPVRSKTYDKLPTPDLDHAAFAGVTRGSGDREASTTMAFVRLIGQLAKIPEFGERIAPIVPDEARTFGMEGLFGQMGIYSCEGQKYAPEDAGQLIFYKETKDGQILEQGITEAGSMGSWTSLATSWSHTGKPMVPIYLFYSIFGAQRTLDQWWAAGDALARGFLIGCTSGRTTLHGEGLQHQDGHSHVLAAQVPSCRCYDVTYGWEAAVITHHGISRMIDQGINEFYYMTVANERYAQPAMPDDSEVIEGVRRGMYLASAAPHGDGPRVRLIGSGVMLREVLKAARILEQQYGVYADVFAATSFSELRREALRVEREQRLHPSRPGGEAWVTRQLNKGVGPVIASSDWVSDWPHMIAPFVAGAPFVALGTDGWGRSDTRAKLREFFEVDAGSVVAATLSTLAAHGEYSPDDAERAIATLAPHRDLPPPFQR